MKTCQGNCHCGAVRFEADIDLGGGTIRCNCSFCVKIRCWATIVMPASFRLIAGESELTEYQFGARNERHFFCRRCGVRPFGIGKSPRIGRFYGVSVACLDDAAVEELAAAPVRYVDGRNDNWTVPPHDLTCLR